MVVGVAAGARPGSENAVKTQTSDRICAAGAGAEAETGVADPEVTAEGTIAILPLIDTLITIVAQITTTTRTSLPLCIGTQEPVNTADSVW